jgi:hypothetical protein
MVGSDYISDDEVSFADYENLHYISIDRTTKLTDGARVLYEGA